MKSTRYITSGGLAFSEGKDMEKLRRFSLKGWHVSGFAFMGYTLEKGESADYIYSIDYRSLKEDEKEEYLTYFSSAGWSLVASQADIHLFRAKSGTKPIYSDRDTMVEKYETSNKNMKTLTISSVLLTILAWAGAMFSSGILHSILTVVAFILTVPTLPIVWTAVSTYSNKWKVEGRSGLVHTVKIIPTLLALASILILFFANDTDNIVRLIAYIIIGAVGIPTAVWVFMALYHIVGKRA